MTATEIYKDETASDAVCGDARMASDLICLAAAPVFAVMALATGFGGAMPDMEMASPLNGMAAMYGLMSVFHAAPWLRLIARRRNSSPHS
jgi:hypothetical protein